MIPEKLQSYDRVCLIDVGYHKGHFVQHFLTKYGIKRHKVRVIGIDPLDHRSWKFAHDLGGDDTICDDFFRFAISTTPGKAKFHIYSETGCNSLHEMNVDKIVKELNSDDGWYCGYQIKKTKEIEVDVITLESVIETINEPLIHFLKIDTQGNDINVIKSCGDRVHNIIFIQMETCVAKNENQIMYKNQTTIDHDIAYMKNLNFEVLDIEDYSQSAPPEANIIFYNKSLI
ncbi:FkbM family methyltransferase [bacterium]|nr:FkbM family methyltransferase [bacterium]